MLTTDKKIDEIYMMLRRQESRRRWSFILSLLWRLLILGLLLSIILYPQDIINAVYSMIAPMVEDYMKTLLEQQTGRIQDMTNNALENVRSLMP